MDGLPLRKEAVLLVATATATATPSSVTTVVAEPGRHEPTVVAAADGPSAPLQAAEQVIQPVEPSLQALQDLLEVAVLAIAATPTAVPVLIPVPVLDLPLRDVSDQGGLAVGHDYDNPVADLKARQTLGLVPALRPELGLSGDGETLSR